MKKSIYLFVLLMLCGISVTALAQDSTMVASQDTVAATSEISIEPKLVKLRICSLQVK